MNGLREMKVGEFVRRLKNLMEDYEDSKFVFFIGAGCSVSSGILSAGTLVKNWLPQLKKLKTGAEENYEKWIKEIYPGYEENKASLFYTRVIEELFLTSDERQREIEKRTEGKDPGFGYAVLAQLMTHEKWGRHCNVILTVNFDDLIADALYLYTQKKPLVLSHESLVGFLKITRTRPLVIKLHGDARLEPKNTVQETRELIQSVKKPLKNLLSETGLIFIGYGGYDNSIVEILNELPTNALPWGTYWVGNKIPDSNIDKWLKDRKALWVKHKDFDELMLLLWDEFELKHPDNKRFDKLLDTYFETFIALKNKVEAKPDTAEKRTLEKAAQKAVSEFKYWRSVLLEADKYIKTDKEKADQIYQKGLKTFPDNSYLLGSYAIFLTKIRKEHDKAEVYYKRAIDANPNDANLLSSYAIFLTEIRKEHDRAEVYYKRAIDAAPNHAILLSNYAHFRADIRKDYDKSEEFYKKAIDANPNDANLLANYAGFLFVQGKSGKGFNFLQKALNLADNRTLVLECLFYQYAHTKDETSMEQSFAKIKELLKSGVRYPSWNLQDNVKRAIEDGHPYPEFLDKLSRVISEEIDIQELEDFDIWKKKL